MSTSISGWEHGEGRGRFGRVLLLSAIGHVIVLGALVLVPQYHRPKYAYLPSYTVNLVELAPPASERPSQAAPAAQEQRKAQSKQSSASKKPKRKPSPPAKTKVAAKKTAPVQPVKVAPVEVKEWKPKTVEEPEVEKRAALAPTPEPPATSREGLARTGRAEVAPLPQPSRSAMVDVSFPYVYYLTIIQNKIGENWRPSLDAYFSPETRRAVVTFEILRTGQIVNVEVEVSSGTRLLDESAIRAVEVSDPLPPLPQEFERDRLRVHFNFEFAQSG